MAKTITAQTLLSKHVTRRDRVLLINPPVHETRYSWVRWNQPLDLLKIASRLRTQVECQVELFDCMKPDAQGNVREDWLPRDRRYYSRQGNRYPMRQFGQPCTAVADRLAGTHKGKGSTQPTQVWITSLCSYWYESVAEVCRVVRQALPDARIVLVGQYARLMPKHALEACAVDVVVSKPCDLTVEPAALDLYGNPPPPFLALQLHPRTAITEVQSAVELGVLHFTFFEDDVCRDGGEPLRKIVEKTQDLHKHLRYHLLCGLHPSSVTPAIARTLAHPKVAELHFEQAEVAGALDVEAYRKTRAYLQEAGLKVLDKRVGGFVWIGRPREQLDELVLRTFQVLDHLGNVILKPFTPTPGGADYREHKDYLEDFTHRHWSPHFFPFAELNGITREEYHDLYRMAAFLNEKVRDASFDFLRGTLGAKMLRDSLRREVWKLEPSPLRIVD